MAKDQNWVVDIIMAQPAVKSNLVEYLESMDHVNIKHKNYKWAGEQHPHIHSFSESINFEKVLNFRDALMAAMQGVMYDAIVINTPEALLSTYALGLQEHVQLMFYTHNENLVFRDNQFKGIFIENYDAFVSALMKLDGIYVGTQTERNARELNFQGLGESKAKVLPMPIPEKELLDSSADVDKKGVLFIGRWEERKNPKEFIRVIKETKLHARVITNATGEKKFREAFKEIGHTDFEIKAGVIGKEKIDFIKASKVFFMPSKSESYGFALMEALCHCQCVVMEKYDWHNNFDAFKQNNLYVSNNPTEAVLKAYHRAEYSSVEKTREYFVEKESKIPGAWVKFFECFQGRQSTSSSATILKKDDIYFRDFIKSLGRTASVEDLASVYSNRHKFNVFQTRHETFLTTGTSLKEREEDTLDAFFQ